MLAAWLAAVGGTALAFTVAGSAALVVTAGAAVVLGRRFEGARLRSRAGTVNA